MTIWRRIANLWYWSGIDMPAVVENKDRQILAWKPRNNPATIVEESTSELLDKLELE